jgi:imidazolonepropionase-like amidohydrolase
MFLKGRRVSSKGYRMTIRVGSKYQHLVGRVGCACHRSEIQAFTHRVTADLTRRGVLSGMVASLASLGMPGPANAQGSPGIQGPSGSATAEGPLLLTNLRLFDGTGAALRSGVQVLIEGNRIAAVDTGNNPAPANGRTIDCGGRVLMPGLIDAHWHATLAPLPLTALMTADAGYIHLVAAKEAERTLMRGFTTVRDVGGPAFVIRKAIDEGLIDGPRIFPSGAMISQTAGHGDFRALYEVPRTGTSLTRTEVLGGAAIADSPDEVRRRTREQLMAGASQIKLMAGGGVASLYDPLDAVQFRPEEIRAAVEAAEDWGTYVAAHVYKPAGIRRCVEAGVRSIEHGQLVDEDTVRFMVDRDVWWSLQPFIGGVDANVYTEPQKQADQRMVHAGTDAAYELAIRHKARVGWGTDILFAPGATDRQGRMLAAMRRWYTPAQVLRMATSANAELLALSGERSPYPARLGVVEKDALADLLLVDGDPTEDLNILADPVRNLRIIMKDGRLHKNTLR